MKTRDARPEDSRAIARIYNQGIEDRIATFETRPRSPGEIGEWFRDQHPLVVVEEPGGVVAFASSSAYSGRECYRGVAEFSVYVERAARRQGAGRLAMEALVAACSDGGFWKLSSRVFVENEASRRLLSSLGFREVGVHEKHARLDGEWRDVVTVELLIPENLE